MRVRFILSMDNLLVHGERIDNLVVDWEDDSTHDEIMRLSQSWISSRNFLTERMNGLTEVGESSLTIEPLDVDPQQNDLQTNIAP